MTQLSQIDLSHSRRIRGRILPTQIQPYDIRMQDPLRWGWSTLFQVIKNQKSCILNTLPIHQVGAKWRSENSILFRFTSLDIQILHPIIFIMIWTLKNPHIPIFVRFQIFYTVKLTNSLFWPSILRLLDGWAKSNQNTRSLVFSYLNNTDLLQRSGSSIQMS